MNKRKHNEIEVAPANETVESINTDADSRENGDTPDGGFLVDGIVIPPPPQMYCNLKEKAPRLVITRIRNNFFKSYGEDVILGPFNKCFNAIVGANGSGKSNVIDSILFVFGYRAKSMRSKNVFNLIHNSENYRNVKTCKVIIYFQQIIDKDGADFEVVPNSEMSVARIINIEKKAHSYYELNGAQVSFEQVATALSGFGIDLENNRFLILQGEIEQIAMMKCKGTSEHDTGFLEYLENIIGTKRYVPALTQLNERLEIVKEQRNEKMNRMNIIQKELEEITQPMLEAVSFLELENEITTQKNTIYQKKIHDVEKHNIAIDKKKTELDEKLNENRQTLTTLQAERKQKEIFIEEHSKKYEQLEKKKEDLTEAFENANRKDIKLQAEMTQINTTRKKNKGLITAEKKKLDDLLALPEKNAKEVIECEKKLRFLVPKKEEHELKKAEFMSTLATATKDLQAKKEVAQTDLINLKKNVDETKAARDIAEFEMKMYISSETNEQKKCDTLREQFESAKSTLKSRKNEIQNLTTSVPEKEQLFETYRQAIVKIKEKDVKLSAEVRSKRNKMEEITSGMAANKSRGRVLDSLLQQRRDGNCNGLFGRLGDLGAIDKKYDVAVSTACGALDNIVVDTVETAQWCIDYLKKYDVGRASFICLDQQEHLRRYANTKINTPENVPRVFDLIHVEDERVTLAFYYGLRNTLVADNLEQASRIAYGKQRYRVVTLDGALIETTGTMTGGGRTVLRGRMGQQVRAPDVDPRELQQLQFDITNLERSVGELRQSEKEHQEAFNRLDNELRTMRPNLRKFVLEVKTLEDQYPVLQTLLKDQEIKSKEVKTDPAQVRRLQIIINEKVANYDEACAAANEVQIQVDEITKQIKAKSSDKIKAIDKNLKDIGKQIEVLKSEINRLNVAVSTSARNAKKSEEKIASFDESIKAAEDTLMKKKAMRDEIENDAAKMLKRIQELTATLEEGQGDSKGIRSEVKALINHENETKAAKIDLDEKMKGIKREQHEIQLTIEKYSSKLRELKLHKIRKESEIIIGTLTKYSSEELDTIEIHGTQNKLQSNEELLRSKKPNLAVIEEYAKQRAVFISRSNELEQINQRKDYMVKCYDLIRTKRREEFDIGFNIIRKKLKEMYQMITLGGDAALEVVDSFDPFSEGIQFNVRPPKKPWKQITDLSGGEKTLSSLALVFALHHYNPSPIYVMDEIDAALDFKNVSIIGNYINERTKNAQFLIISLRNYMFELCDYMIGIYKVYNCTKSLSINPNGYSTPATPAKTVPALTQNPATTEATVAKASYKDGATNNKDTVPDIHITNVDLSNINEVTQGSLTNVGESQSQTHEPMDVDGYD